MLNLDYLPNLGDEWVMEALLGTPQLEELSLKFCKYIGGLFFDAVAALRAL